MFKETDSGYVIVNENFLGSVRVYEGGLAKLIYGYWEKHGLWWLCNGVWYRDVACTLIHKQ